MRFIFVCLGSMSKETYLAQILIFTDLVHVYEANSLFLLSSYARASTVNKKPYQNNVWNLCDIYWLLVKLLQREPWDSAPFIHMSEGRLYVLWHISLKSQIPNIQLSVVCAEYKYFFNTALKIKMCQILL